MTRGCAQNAAGSLRSSGSWLVAQSMPNLARHLVAPLADQRRRRQDQDAFGHAAQDVFLQHHPGLDGLAETDLVGQQHTAAILLQHLADGLGLIPMRLHALQRRQAEQFVEPLEQAEADQFAAQAERDRVWRSAPAISIASGLANSNVMSNRASSRGRSGRRGRPAGAV